MGSCSCGCRETAPVIISLPCFDDVKVPKNMCESVREARRELWTNSSYLSRRRCLYCRHAPQVEKGQELTACQRSLSVRHRDHARSRLGVAGPGLARHERKGPGGVGEHRGSGAGLDGIAQWRPSAVHLQRSRSMRHQERQAPSLLPC